ncbi:tRNA 2-thiouridine(34) synthase MnmA [Natranaerobius thermophilus JW/NM-WN-LF]|nr:tRNA 2-thiouridine(34) synthase MnmA [Natranaerobius thermophilus]
MSNRVLVAMSGGVDSSVAALMLKEQGYEVIGAHMRIWYREEDEELYEQNVKGCCSLAAVHDAKRVADKIGIPFYVLNFKEPFYDWVVKNFIDEYLQGRTPNPCIACNRFIKWEEFLKRAMALECDYIATGHYSKIVYDNLKNRYLLYRGKDKTKDQSYMLSQLTQEQLARTLFPLGDYYKEDVRNIAEQNELGVADKPDSQEICFVPNNDYGEFLQSVVPEHINPGPILDAQGNKLGEHKGIAFYTIGQRRGLGISLGRPVYVIDIDADNNALIVGDKEELYSDGLIAEEINLIPYEQIENSIDIECKIRYNSRNVSSTLQPYGNDQLLVKFNQPVEAVTPGQGVTFYQDDLVIGGGTILKATTKK